MAVTVTVDVEDHRPKESAEVRFDRSTVAIADWLVERGWRGTFFVVGAHAQRWPHVAREIADRGHEVALHGYEHRPLQDLGARELADQVRRGRELLVEQSGQDVVGFRAPQFSLVAETPWAADVLAESGCRYSSSVLPAPSPLFGYPGAPTVPFRWPSGLVELPAPLVGPPRMRVPVGGLYLRALPMRLLGRWATDQAMGEAGWLYIHPYDVDPGERFYVIRDANPLASPLQWWHRRQTFDRVEALVRGRPGAPLREVAAGLDPSVLRPFSPSTSHSELGER